jgi:hypothetical protein
MPARRIPLSYRSHVTGSQPFIPGARAIAHESALERDFVTVCRFDPEVIGVEEQPVTIYWTDATGRERRYTPDYKVIRRTGVEIAEVKYWKDLAAHWRDYKPVFIMARNWAALQGMRFRIATDRNIRRPFLANAKRLLPRIDDAVPAEIKHRITWVLERQQPVRLSELVEAVIGSESPREIILSALWALFARRVLLTNFDVDIDGDSPVCLPGGRL